MMRALICLLLFLSATHAFALQQAQPQTQKPPYTAPPQQPPQAAPQEQDKSMSNQDIQSQLQSDFGNDPVLNNANVNATVDDQNITLTGTVQSQAQRDRALALSQTYARYRKIVDKITVQ